MADLLARLPRPGSERGRDALGAGLLVVALTVLQLVDAGPAGLAGWEFAGALLACAALVWRRAAPVPVLLVAFAAFAGSTVADGALSTAFVPFAVAVYTAVSRAGQLPVAFVIGALSVVATGAALVFGLGRSASDPVVVSAEVWVALVAAVGVAVSLYRRALDQERARAREAEATRDAVASRRVAEERLRIARELHDAVGHHVAVMNVQAGVAEALLATKPAQAAVALGRVQEAGARVLEELPVMLRVLRTADDDDTRPGVSLADLDELVALAREAGLEVELHREGPAPDLSAAADLAAYRIVQEALTNARRYGNGGVTVAVATTASGLTLEIRNRLGTAASGGSGFGLVGMRERATTAGGTVDAGPLGDEFVVRAVLPLRGTTSVKEVAP